MSDFSDKDPEDVYDATDPPLVRLAVLDRVLAHLRDRPDDGRREARRTDALRVLDNLITELRDTHDQAQALRESMEAL